MCVQSLSREDLLEEGMAAHSSILIWRIPWTEEPGGLQSMGFSRQEYWSGLPFPSPVHERKSENEVTQLCLTLSDPIDCSLPGSSVPGILQARVLEWVAISFSSA